MVFYITGPDTYRALEKVHELKEKFLREVDPTGLNLSDVDASGLTTSDLHHFFSTAPLMARRRCVVLRDLLKAKGKDVATVVPKLLADGEQADSHIVIVYEREAPSEKHALHGWLKEHAHTQQFPLLEGAGLRRYLQDRATARGRTITSGAVDLILERSRGDLWAAMRLLEVCDATADISLPLDEQHVQSVSGPLAATDIFPLVDAVVRRDRVRAVPRLMDYFEQGENPQQLVSLLETQFRVLLLLIDGGPTTAPHGVHPYVVKKLQPLARTLSRSAVQQIYLALREVDEVLKSTSLDPRTVLLRFVVTN